MSQNENHDNFETPVKKKARLASTVASNLLRRSYPRFLQGTHVDANTLLFLDRDVEEEVNREWTERLMQILNCPVCYELIRPPVDMCSNGHSVCYKCRTRLDKCPICSADFVKAKNTMLSQVADFVKYPCYNASGGCVVLLYLRDEENHLKTCTYTVHQCKVDSCPWVGKKEDLLAHVQSQHEDDLWDKEWNFAGSRKFIHDDDSDEFGKLLVIGGEMFWMLTNYDSDRKKLYKCFQFIGPPERAKQFSYHISLKATGNSREVNFRFPVDDDTKHRGSAYDSANCTVVDFNILKSISSCSLDNKLKYLYTITKLATGE